MNSDRFIPGMLSVEPTSSNSAIKPATSNWSTDPERQLWWEILVENHLKGQDCLCYGVPSDIDLKPGDIVSVPYGTQTLRGIAIKQIYHLPTGLTEAKLKAINDVVETDFFPQGYWPLLQQVADYYLCGLIEVVRVALPAGMLKKSQKRIRLCPDALPPGVETFCSPVAYKVLQLLRQQRNGDYSTRYLCSKVKNANQGINFLLRRNWAESYLEIPRPSQAKLKTAVMLVSDRWIGQAGISPRQTEILRILANSGGEIWKTELIKLAQTTSATLNKIAELGYIAFQEQEILRKEQGVAQEPDRAKQLNSDQLHALEQINAQTNSQQGYCQILLHGVTGSGKTEVYLQAIAKVLQQGKSALVLVPEIGLTPQLTDRFRARFGSKVCVYHSKLSAGERYDTWRQTILGDPQIIIGTRSAIFAPLPKIGLIVLDEEHDSSFKQNRPVPTYHARTVAQFRAQLADCPLILGSATPSLESYVECYLNNPDLSNPVKQENRQLEQVTEKYDDCCQNNPDKRSSQQVSRDRLNSIPLIQQPSHYLALPNRIGNSALPPVQIVDMREELNRGNRSIFSLALQKAIANVQERQQQAILFIPRRGYSTFVSCRSCGFVMECPNCDVSLSYHHANEEATKLLRCHYCNYTSHQPKHCPQCSSPYLKFFGSGTQKVTQELSKLYPDLRVIRFDSDTTRSKNAHRELIASFTSGEADILVGTQMLTKGLDIAGVTLVGVVAADGLLHRSDYRAAEKALQILTQVAGRAGRGEEPGEAIIQTYAPEHPVIGAVKNHDYQSFSQQELAQRQTLSYPPYGKLILIRLSSPEELLVQKAAEAIADVCSELLDASWSILGPAPAVVAKVARRYRWQILLKNANKVPQLTELQKLKDYCQNQHKQVSITFDIDPINID